MYNLPRITLARLFNSSKLLADTKLLLSSANITEKRPSAHQFKSFINIKKSMTPKIVP